eukprot:c25626_g1_i1 orf=233-2161(+)
MDYASDNLGHDAAEDLDAGSGGSPMAARNVPSGLAGSQTAKYELLGSDGPHGRKALNAYALSCAVLASMNSILLGYDIGVTSGAVLFIREDLQIGEFEEEILVSSLNLVSLGGAAVAGRIADAIGRRWTMASAAFVFLIGAALMGVAPSFGVLMLGRLVAGIGVGFALMIAPVYTAEVAPASCRGSLVSLPEIFINVGVLLGYISNYVFAGLPTRIGWRLMLGLGTVPAIMLGVGVLIMPESPRWLVMQKRIHEAEIVLLKTSEDKAEADKRLVDIMEAAGLTDAHMAEKMRHSSLNVADMIVPDVSSFKKNDGKGVWRDLLCPSPPVRRMLQVAMGIQFFQQATGIDATVYYSPEVFKEVGIRNKAGLIGATVAVGFTKTIFILVATFLLDRVGRKPLLLTSTAGMTASLFLLAFRLLFLDKHNVLSDSIPAEAIAPNGVTNHAAALVIFAVCSYVSFFSIGMGPICWVMTTEIFPLQLRAQAMSLGIVINRVASGAVSLTFLSISDAISFAGTYFLFAGVSAVSVIFIFFFVPETKGKTLEDVCKFFYREGEERFSTSSMLELGEGTFSGEDKQCEELEAGLTAPARELFDEEVEMLADFHNQLVFDSVSKRDDVIVKAHSISKQGKGLVALHHSAAERP